MCKFSRSAVTGGPLVLQCSSADVAHDDTIVNGFAQRVRFRFDLECFAGSGERAT